LLKKTLPKDIADSEAAIAIINRIGNCTLVEKCFNISKSDRTMKSFLEEVINFKEDSTMLPAWATALEIPDNMLDPTDKKVDDLVNAIDAREKMIYQDLEDFIKGAKVRCDIAVPKPNPANSINLDEPKI
jgi:hypothetical protein